MFHDGMTPSGSGYARCGRGQAGPAAKVQIPGALAGANAVAGAMLDACGLGDAPCEPGHSWVAQAPAAHYRRYEELPGPFISLN